MGQQKSLDTATALFGKRGRTAQLRDAVGQIEGRCETEASGGVTLDTVRAVAETGVDFISVGALTHSAMAVDIGLDYVGTLQEGAVQ